jgi:DNA-binding MarR family transcriptional regulator
MSAARKHRTEHQLDELLDVLLVRGHQAAHLLLSRHLSGTLYRRVAGDIPPVQLQALAVLAGGDMRMRELAHRLGLATSTVTRLVDRLEAAGLAERRSHRPDRRSVLVGLSRAGRTSLQSVRRRLRALMRELIANLSPHEQGELLRLLTRLGESLGPQPLEPARAPARGRPRGR